MALTDRDGVFADRAAPASRSERSLDLRGRPRPTTRSRAIAEVDRAVARLFAARARQEAVRRNRDGDFDGARRVLDGTARRIQWLRRATTRTCASSSTTLASEEQVTYAAPMAEASRKRAHFASANILRSRDALGSLDQASLNAADERALRTALIRERIVRTEGVRLVCPCPAADV